MGRMTGGKGRQKTGKTWITGKQGYRDDMLFFLLQLMSKNVKVWVMELSAPLG
jgi:hypothetical protein